MVISDTSRLLDPSVVAYPAGAASCDLRTSLRRRQVLDDVPGQTGTGADPEPLVDVLQVRGHRAPADEQPVGDLGVGEPLRDQPRDLRFPAAQPAGQPYPRRGPGVATEPAQQPPGAVGHR